MPVTKKNHEIEFPEAKRRAKRRRKGHRPPRVRKRGGEARKALVVNSAWTRLGRSAQGYIKRQGYSSRNGNGVCRGSRMYGKNDKTRGVQNNHRS